MKKNLFILSAIILLNSCVPICPMVSFNKSSQTGKFIVSEVINVEGVSKKELYKRSQIYLAKAFVNSKSVIAYSDKEEAYIIGKGSTIVNVGNDFGAYYYGEVSYSIELISKDGKLQINLSDFIHSGNGKVPTYGRLERVAQRKSAACVLDYMNGYSRNLVADLKKSITITQEDF